MYDVAIIGAGISGLAAAEELVGSKSFIILEARNRAGGRIHTLQTKDAFIDLGAEFLHGSAEATKKLAKEAHQKIYKVQDIHHLFLNDDLIPVHDFWEKMDAFLEPLHVKKDLPYDELIK